MLLILMVLLLISVSSMLVADDMGLEHHYPAFFGTEMRLEAEASFSTNLYVPTLEANEYGVYPVLFNVKMLPELTDFITVELEAIDAWGNPVFDEPVNLPVNRTTVLEGGLSPERPGEVWYYRYRLRYYIGDHCTSWSAYKPGYGALTPDAFIGYFEKYAMKPWEFADTEPEGSSFNSKWSESKILEKVSAHSLKSLGDITESSTFHGGTVHYLSKAKGFKGDIFFTYDDFGEARGIKSTGNFNMLGVSLQGNGKKCEGEIVVEGLYPATVDLSHIMIVKYMPEGSYVVTQEGRLPEYVKPEGNLSFE